MVGLNIYNIIGVYVDMFQVFQGCDSIVNIILMVLDELVLMVE